MLPADSPFLALDPPQRRQRTLEVLKRVLLRESQVQPLMLVFEDLHWIDSETQALLNNLAESLPTARLLLLVNYRPEYQHGWGSKTYYAQLRLDPLPAASAEAFLQALQGDDPSLAPLKQLLIARTEGNPFFLEESVRTLVETGVLVGETGARLAKPLDSLQVPATIQAVLAARIDRLREAEALAEHLHDQRRLGQVLASTISFWWLMGAPERAVEYGERACAIAAALGDVVVQMCSTLTLGQAYVTMGYYRQAADYLSRTIDALQDDLPGPNFGSTIMPAVMSRAWLAWSLAELGEFAEGIAAGAKAIQMAEVAGHPFTLITACYGLFSTSVEETSTRPSLCSSMVLKSATLGDSIRFPSTASPRS